MLNIEITFSIDGLKKIMKMLLNCNIDKLAKTLRRLLNFSTDNQAKEDCKKVAELIAPII